MSDGSERTAEERAAARRADRRDGSDQRRADEDFDAEQEFGDEEFEDEEPLGGEHEVPSGTRRVSRLRRPPPVRGRAPRASAAGGGSRVPRQAERRHSRAGRIGALLALLAAAALIWFLVELFQPFYGHGHGSVTVTIPAHSSSSQVGDLLARNGVISSSFFFELRATLEGDRGEMRAGTYRLSRGMSYGEVLKVLTTPPPAAPVTEVTIVPGRTRRQIDALLRSEGVAGSYLAATRHSPLLHPSSYGAPRNTPSLEGFMFPDTYQLRQPVSIASLVADQLQAFRQQFATVGLEYASSKHLSAYDVLIIASMVEAEAGTAHDRPLVASVIYNRLALGMPLQIDATTRYATGNYTRPLTQAELGSNSPYNTRLHAGLPPTAIDNPSLASLQAAAHPARTDYLYFVVKPCGNGAQAFASNYQQFLGEVQQYYSARSQRAGRSPVQC